MKQRFKPEVRREQIITHALRLARVYGYREITRSEIAGASGITGAAISYHFETMDGLRDALMRAAVDRFDYVVIAQGLAAMDPIAIRAPDEVKRRAAGSLL